MKSLAAAFAATALLSLAAAAQPGGAPAPGPTLKGEVLEVQNVQGYTYLRLKTREGETWASVPTANVKKGEQVTLTDTMVMKDFQSKALNRKFDRLVFGTIEGAKAAPAPAAAPHATMSAPPGTKSPHGGGQPAAAPVAKIAKAKGADARTVAEVIDQRAALKGKSVTIRGQVVKVNNGILGKNWVHLQDGSGSADKGTHDIIVTTKDTVAMNDVVTASGTVRTDVNVGSGYAYPVMVEDAKVRK